MSLILHVIVSPLKTKARLEAETINGLYKAEVIHRRGPCRSFDAVEFATLEWVDWLNNRRLLEPIGHPAGRGRGILPCHAGPTRYGGVTQTKQPPESPGRFNDVA